MKYKQTSSYGNSIKHPLILLWLLLKGKALGFPTCSKIAVIIHQHMKALIIRMRVSFKPPRKMKVI